MTFKLQAISLADLKIMALSAIPRSIAARVAEDALPPAFVALRALSLIEEDKSLYGCGTFYIVRDSDQTIVGSCGFKYPPAAGCVEIGYGVSSSCRKQGAATAAVQALLDLAFATEEVNQVLAQVNLDNAASSRVVQKLNFENSGVKLDEYNEPAVQWLAHKRLQA